MKYLISFCILFLLFSTHATGQETLANSIDSLLKLETPRSFNGVILVARNGKELYNQSHGWADRTARTALAPDDQFVIGSVSKQVTATLVLREVQAGRIGLNQVIRTYLPGLAESWADSVTVQQLLHHTSGIREWNKPLLFPPGTRFSYTNLNYALLGQIVEKTSGQSYAALAENLFKRCKMNATAVPLSTGGKEGMGRLVKGYVENEDHILEEETGILGLLHLPVMGVPASGIVSTAGDLTRWVFCLHGGELLADSIYRMMSTDAVVRPHRWGALKYGDGIQVDELDNIHELSISGYVPGFITTVIYYPATQVSIVILENVSPDPSDMGRAFYFHDQVRLLVRRQL